MTRRWTGAAQRFGFQCECDKPDGCPERIQLTLAEFATITWFDDIGAVKAFVGEDYDLAHVPERARAVLSQFDGRSAHYEVIDRHYQAAS